MGRILTMKMTNSLVKMTNQMVHYFTSKKRPP